MIILGEGVIYCGIFDGYFSSYLISWYGGSRRVMVMDLK
jgi:hypothetical protein